MYLTATSLAELLVGIEVLPVGKRKEGLDAALAERVSTLFGSRVLPFDHHAAMAYARLVNHARTSGRIISVADAACAAVATRDTEPFVATGVPVINPWEV